jgi:hypothetical protein
MVDRGIIAPGATKVPPKMEVYAKPEDGEVVVFKDFFSAGLRFPLDPAVVDVFAHYGVFLHQMTPNTFIWLNLFLWLMKIFRITPSVENFARVSRIHYQPKTISIRDRDGQPTVVEPQYGCYTFTFQQISPSPVAATKNKWPGD